MKKLLLTVLLSAVLVQGLEGAAAAGPTLKQRVAELNAALIASISGNGVVSAQHLIDCFFTESPELLEGPGALMQAVYSDFLAAAGAIACRCPMLIDQEDDTGISPRRVAACFGRSRISMMFKTLPIASQS